MTTINLEKKLIRSNKKLNTPEELLLINEYEKQATLAENEILERVGMNRNIKEGKTIKENTLKKKNQTRPFNQERVFHISQIEQICEKYYLRFLSVYYYKGSVDKELPVKISNFETAYSIKCDTNDLFIVAPAESFKLERKPKDPLLFYQISDEYYYLVHKWGNDLSIFRRSLVWFSKPLFCIFFITVICPIPLLFIHLGAYLSMFALLSFFCWTWTIIDGGLGDNNWMPIRLKKKNDWNSHYLED